MDVSLNLGQTHFQPKKEEKLAAKELDSANKTNTPSGVFNAVPDVETAGTIASAAPSNSETAGTIASSGSSSSSGGSFSSLA